MLSQIWKGERVPNTASNRESRRDRQCPLYYSRSTYRKCSDTSKRERMSKRCHVAWWAGGRNEIKAARELTNAATYAVEWASENAVAFKADKTEAMLLTRKHKSSGTPKSKWMARR